MKNLIIIFCIALGVSTVSCNKIERTEETIKGNTYSATNFMLFGPNIGNNETHVISFDSGSEVTYQILDQGGNMGDNSDVWVSTYTIEKDPDFKDRYFITFSNGNIKNAILFKQSKGVYGIVLPIWTGDDIVLSQQ